MAERNEQGQIIAEPHSQEQSTESPLERHQKEQIKLFTEIRDLLCEMAGKTPSEVGVPVALITGKPKKKPGRPRKTHEHEVG